ncbi:GNAT family N-acetyltransferase [Dickeya undicola]|uniref:GNAT family N-acetyltransferase n=1 Tax=Dickeya undicola TaxID=1577887 RepID=A0A3N0GB64_9GAMM|nr:N-acetyltransferase [Dickeya undicola]RNM09581.1 GNAT family N-acetyltransferase [Dickeya undicola]RNM21211.1 GNAT family N-acetyltransferase [Dickeya undicola]
MIIRRLATDDFAEFRRVRLEGLQQAPHAFGSTWQKEQAEPASTFIARLDTNHVWGMFAPECRLCGIAAYAEQSHDEGIIWGVYVTDALRGSGATDRLLRALINDARAHLSHLTLTVMRDNHPAIRLYQRLGFQRLSIVSSADDSRQTWFMKLK